MRRETKVCVVPSQCSNSGFVDICPLLLYLLEIVLFFKVLCYNYTTTERLTGVHPRLAVELLPCLPQLILA